MLRATIVLAAAFGAVPPAFAADPVAVRQALMEANGAAAALAGGMLKGEIAYSPAAGNAAIHNFAAVAAAFGDYFPEGSTGANTAAAPKIWEDRAGFDAELQKFASAATAAVAAAGRGGPADLDAFKAAVGPAMQACQACHETYRIRR